MNLSPTDYRELLSDLLGQGLTCETRMRGKSMRPTIEDGALVTVGPLDNEELRPGDILLLTTPDGHPLCHRLVRIIRRGGQVWVQTWGDATPWPDLPVPVESVLGRVERVRSGTEERGREALLHAFRWPLRRRRLCLRIPGLLRARAARLTEPCAPSS